MTLSPGWSCRFRGLASIVALVLATSCREGGQSVTGIAAASGSVSGDPSVVAVSPDSGAQDTTLDVVVTGSNFDRGSRVDFAFAGVVSDSVRTNRTTFVNSRKLIANITIAAHADTGRYDVVVTTAGGKKGIGTELFAIKSNRLIVEFTSTLSLFADILADYTADPQPVKGMNSGAKVNVNAPYTLTIANTAVDVAGCEDGGGRLANALGVRTGTLGVQVDKTQFVNGESGKGVVVNFTTTGADGASYFLTTGGGQNRLIEIGPGITRIAKSNGFVRVKKDGERVGALCNGIVEFEFTVSN